MEPEYRTLNRAVWDERAPAHAASPDYDVAAFEDPGYLSDTVTFDRPRLGDVRGLAGVHLQCHIGTDTVSLARLGAQMCGLDFSPASLAEARRLAARTGADVAFHEGDVYDAAALLGTARFDLVYTGIGALCWLPDIRRWAGVVAALLRPGGRLFMREGHPVLWATGDIGPDEKLCLEAPYFEQATPNVYRDAGTYVATERTFVADTTMEWNHGLGEIVTALLDAGLAITALVEHDSVPWEAFPGHMVRRERGEWQLRDRPARLPHTYTLQAHKGHP